MFSQLSNLQILAFVGVGLTLISVAFDLRKPFSNKTFAHSYNDALRKAPALTTVIVVLVALAAIGLFFSVMFSAIDYAANSYLSEVTGVDVWLTLIKALVAIWISMAIVKLVLDIDRRGGRSGGGTRSSFFGSARQIGLQVVYTSNQNKKSLTWAMAL